jgi:hypothetical protein
MGKECNTDLVDSLTVEDKMEDLNFVEVLQTFNPADVALLKSLLHNENFTYYFDTERFMYARPFGLPVRLMVKSNEADIVKELIKDLDLSYNGVDLRTTNQEDEI